MAVVIIQLDTDGEAVWFQELARKLGHNVEMGFGDNAHARLSYSHSLEVQINENERVDFYAKSPFKIRDLERFNKILRGKNPKK